MVEILVSVRLNGSAEKNRSHGTNYPHFSLADDMIDILEVQRIHLFCLKT